MAQTNYNHVITEAKGLTLIEQLRLLEEMAVLIRKKTTETPHTRSILELQGKGKELWADVDVDKYIDEERSSWDG